HAARVLEALVPRRHRVDRALLEVLDEDDVRIVLDADVARILGGDAAAARRGAASGGGGRRGSAGPGRLRAAARRAARTGAAGRTGTGAARRARARPGAG